MGHRHRRQFRTVHALEDSDDRIDLSATKDALYTVLDIHYLAVWDLVQQHRAVTIGSTEPGEPLSTLILVFARNPNIRRWYVHRRDTDLWIPAKETDTAVAIANVLKGLLDYYRKVVNEFNSGGLAAIEIPRHSLPLDLEKASLSAESVYPRLQPNEYLTEWTLLDVEEPGEPPEVVMTIQPDTDKDLSSIRPVDLSRLDVE